MPRLRPVFLLIILAIPLTIFYTSIPQRELFTNLISRRTLSSNVYTLFEQSYAVSAPDRTLSAISEVCSETEWSEDIYIQCQDMFAGLTSIMNEVKTCFRMAMDLGYHIVMPTIAIRDKETLTDFNRENDKSHLPYDQWFDQDYFIQRMRKACPQMKVASLKSDKSVDLDLYQSLEFDIATLPMYSGWGLYAWSGNDWTQTVKQNISASLTTHQGGPVVVEIAARMAFYAVVYDSTGMDLRVWNELNYIIRPTLQARTVLGQVLDAMQSIPGVKPYYGIHFRVEKDSAGPWTKSDAQILRIIETLEKAYTLYNHAGKMSKVAYVACGDQGEIEKLRNAALQAGWIITDKYTLAKSASSTSPNLLQQIEDLPFDHQGMIDLGVLLLSEFFIGLTNSAFSYTIAHARSPTARYLGSSLMNYKDVQIRQQATHLFFEGEGAYPCCL